MVCKQYSRAFLHTLAAKETLGSQLLTYHNIAYQMRLMREMRQAIMEDRFAAFVQQFMLLQYPAKDYPSWAREALESVKIPLL